MPSRTRRSNFPVKVRGPGVEVTLTLLSCLKAVLKCSRNSPGVNSELDREGGHKVAACRHYTFSLT